MAKITKKKTSKYLTIARHYESCLQKHGDSYLGNDWPRAKEVNQRHQIMLEVIPRFYLNKKRIKLLDFGCGTSSLYEYIKKKNYRHLIYSGLDVSRNFIKISRAKFPDIKYYCGDVLSGNYRLPMFDYIIVNGVFTQKRELSFQEMFSFVKKVLKKLYLKVNKGLAFNVMSKQVDWETKENFYLSFDKLADFLSQELSRRFVIRHDYGLYEYTTYIYK